MNATSHITRNAGLAVATLVALTVAAGIAVNGALAAFVALAGLGLVALILPAAVIHYDEHQGEPRPH